MIKIVLSAILSMHILFSFAQVNSLREVNLNIDESIFAGNPTELEIRFDSKIESAEHKDIKMLIGKGKSVSGVLYFNIAAPEGPSKAICTLKTKFNNKEEFMQLLKTLFCETGVQKVIFNKKSSKGCDGFLTK